MNSAINFIYDADNAFRAPGQAAITATTADMRLPLDKLDKVRGARRNELGAQTYRAVIAVEEVDGVNGDETYAFAVNVGAAGATATKVGEITVGSTGQYVVMLDAQTVEKMDADRAEIELTATLGGTTPSIKFAAWLV